MTPEDRKGVIAVVAEAVIEAEGDGETVAARACNQGGHLVHVDQIVAFAAHQREGFSWWARRLERARELYDLTRVDHFRAFAGYWSVPAGAGTAMEGSWVSGPGRELFDAVRGKIGEVAIIAEDLGVITPDVTEARLSFFFVAVPLFRPRTGRRISDKETHSRHPASSLSNRPPIHHS
jgi:4-alpha-glucanotransferase